jgi:hypothetical protein
MFDRFIRLARARKALREGRYDEALQFAADPLIRADRRAEELRSMAREHLLVRARQRLQAGDHAAVRAELVRLRAFEPVPAVEALAAELAAAQATATLDLDHARRAITEARQALMRGDLALAASLLASPAAAVLPTERDQLGQWLGERGRQAVEALTAAAAALAGGDLDAALARHAAARGFDRELASPAAAAAAQALLPRLATELIARARVDVDTAFAAGDAVGALGRFRALTQEQPWLVGAAGLRALADRVHRGMLEHLRLASAPSEVLPLCRRARALDVALPEPLAAVVDAVLRAEARGDGADAAAVVAELRVAAEAIGARGLAAAAAALADAEASVGALVEAARCRLAGGDLEGARAELVEILTRRPMHEGARRELDLVDQGLLDLDRRLDQARGAARAGRLREACTLALALAGTKRVGGDAQQVVADVRARMALVDRGLDEVRVALHGRAAASLEGVRHCHRRLEELAKVQVDHEDLVAATAAVAVEIEALQVLERAVAALARRAPAEAAQAVEELLTMRPQLLSPCRLDARLGALGDTLTALADQALAAGCVGEVELCAATLGKLAVAHADLGGRAERLLLAAAQRRDAAERLLDAARRQLAARDLGEAERLLDQAQMQWVDGAPVRALADQLRDLRQQTAAIAKVAALAAERDFLGANQKLAELPPTPALLRTRIYDMKQSLARAQGLDGAFLMRVDEGGEHLVVRGETVTIGNVRQTRSDLPVLANLAGRHASLRRSMSFHGGMVDSVVAEEGEVRVRGERITQHKLEPGDRVQLGPSLGLVYQRPSPRSLSVCLHLQGGFQVAGTDRVVVMKDRGRDGRILLGPGRDVHVRVPRATGEVELFTTPAGQMRVTCPAGGTIDGQPFRGEHPLGAGEVVEAAGITFVLMPWRPTA